MEGIIMGESKLDCIYDKNKKSSIVFHDNENDVFFNLMNNDIYKYDICGHVDTMS